MFAIGDKVVYPVHGAGVIEAIEKREVLGEERNYYVLRIFSGDMKLLVPVENIREIGMRGVISSQEADDVLTIFTEKADILDDNWNRRYRLNMEKIKSGNVRNVAIVVRNLMLRDNERPLSAGEKKMLEYARRILFSELMLAQNEDE
ncbi:MAG: CarD family transcriptional regulator, partial [Clostridiales bacterium]